MYAIETKDIIKYFYKERSLSEALRHPFSRKARITALNNLNLRVKYGEIYGLLGPNGAGKTTLLKILSTIMIPDSGKAFIDGIDVLKEPERAKFSIGLVYGEERSFFWRLTGKQNLNFYASLYNMPAKDIAKEVEYVLHLVGLKNEANYRIEDYSTGMRHRLAIARGLLVNPKILLMDEPTLGVDLVGREMLQHLIKNIVKETGTTVLLITHDLEEAENLCDRIGIIHKGRIVTEIEDIKNKDLNRIFKAAVKE